MPYEYMEGMMVVGRMFIDHVQARSYTYLYVALFGQRSSVGGLMNYGSSSFIVTFGF